MNDDLEKMVTVDTILDWLQGKVEAKEIIEPSVWLDAGMKLNVLLGEEEDRLFDLQQKVAQAKYDFIKAQAKKNISEATAFVEASNEYKDMKKQGARIGRIVEFIRLAKVQARLRTEEMKGY